MIVFAASVSWAVWVCLFCGCVVTVISYKNRRGRH